MAGSAHTAFTALAEEEAPSPRKVSNARDL